MKKIRLTYINGTYDINLVLLGAENAQIAFSNNGVQNYGDNATNLLLFLRDNGFLNLVCEDSSSLEYIESFE